MSGKYETQEKKKTRLIILLIIGIVICIGVTIWALFFRQSDEALIPDYAPQETEQNARPIEGDDDTSWTPRRAVALSSWNMTARSPSTCRTARHI